MLEQTNDAERGSWTNYLADTFKRYPEYHEKKLLENAISFAYELIPFYESLNTDETPPWVSRSVYQFFDAVAVPYFKNADFDLEMFSNVYSDISRKNEGARAAAIAGLIAQIDDINDTDLLIQIVQLSKFAESHSREQRDLAWVIKRITSLAKLASRRITLIEPFYEGVYLVDSDGETNQALGVFDKITILEMGGQEGIVVNLYSTKTETNIYSFQESTIVGSNLTANVYSKESVATIEVNIDRASRSIKGFVESLDGRIAFSAKQQVSMDVFSEGSKCDDKESRFEGAWQTIVRGNSFPVFANLLIKGFPNNQYAARFTDNIMKITFIGEEVVKGKVLSLYGTDGYKLILSCLPEERGEGLRGVLFSTSQAVAMEVELSNEIAIDIKTN